jgi:hypothetical protein
MPWLVLLVLLLFPVWLMTGVSSDDDDFEAGATHLSKTPSHETLLLFFFFFFWRYCCFGAVPHDIPSRAADQQCRKRIKKRRRNSRALDKTETSRCGAWTVPPAVVFLLLKGGELVVGWCFPAQGPRKTPDRRPKVRNVWEEKKKPSYTWTGMGGKRHTSAGRDDRGRFTTGTQLEVSIARHRCRSVCSAAFTFTAAKGAATPPPGGHHHCCCCCCCCCIFAFCVPALRFYLVSVPFQEER